MSVARGLSLSVTLQARIEEAAERNANYVSSTTLAPPRWIHRDCRSCWAHVSDAQKLMLRGKAAEFEELERSAEEQRAAQASEPPSTMARDEYLLQQLEHS